MPTSAPSPFAELDDEERQGDQTLQFSRPRAASGRAALPTIRVVAGADVFAHAAIAPGESVVIGREVGVDLRLHDNAVSKRHLELLADEVGQVWARDLRSTNGTTLNGAPMTMSRLNIGDRLVVGAFELRLDLLTTEELAHLGRVSERLAVAGRDPLTGLLSRAWMQDELAGAVGRADQSGQPISVIYVDIDHFKRVNDGFGHAVGDAVLSVVGRLLLSGVRDRDVCVRYGGEELVVFLPATRCATAVEIADRLRVAVARHPWSSVAVGLSVTASFGVAERRFAEAAPVWLDRADRALYAAKHGGRDRVEAAVV